LVGSWEDRPIVNVENPDGDTSCTCVDISSVVKKPGVVDIDVDDGCVEVDDEVIVVVPV